MSRGPSTMSPLVPGLALLLGGCGEAIDPNAAGGATNKGASALGELPDEPETASDGYYYNPAGKRDPFQGFVPKTPGGRPPPTAVDGGPPLQRWDVDKFVLRGIIWNTQSPRAVLVDPDGLGHVVRVGTYVGRNWGKVTSITQTGLVVTEEYQNIEGELIVNPVSVRFPQSVEARK